MRGLSIVCTGIHLPACKVTAAETERRLDLPEGWIAKKSGSLERYFCKNETVASMGAAAVRRALDRAGLRFSDLDLLISASASFEQIIPCTASLIQEALGESASGVPGFDINSTCLSFLVALEVATSMMHGGAYRRILIVSSEVGSKGLNDRHAETATLIGDGAAAVLLQKDTGDAQTGLVDFAMKTYSEGAHLTEIPGGGARRYPLDMTTKPTDFMFHMDGPAVYRMAAETLPPFIEAFLTRNGLSAKDISLVIPHQASLPALKLLNRKMGFSDDQMMWTLQRYGNTIAASIPLGIDAAIAEGRIKRGSHVLMWGTSAGFSIGAALWKA